MICLWTEQSYGLQTNKDMKTDKIVKNAFTAQTDGQTNAENPYM